MKKDREVVLLVAAVLQAGALAVGAGAWDPDLAVRRAKTLINITEDFTPESEGWR